MPCDMLSLGQADAGHEKGATNKPHLQSDVVSYTDRIWFLYIKGVTFESFCSIWKFSVASQQIHCIRCTLLHCDLGI